MERPCQKHVIVMADDEMAFLFTGPSEAEPAAKEKEPSDVHGLADRLLREFKSFLPKVSRVRPVEAVFASRQLGAGKPVRLVAPSQALYDGA
jgi:hypothetical protein